MRDNAAVIHVFIVYRSVRSSLLGRGAVRRPKPSTRRAKRDFLLQTSVGAYANDWPLVVAALLVLLPRARWCP